VAEKPLTGATVTVDIPPEVTLVGLAVTVKSWTVTVTMADRVRPLAVPETWQVYVAATVELKVRVKLAVAAGADAGPVQPERLADEAV
jgi:hypothetical protein